MGRSLAVNLAKRGCEVAISDVDEVGLAETARLADAAKPGLRVTKKVVDVSSEEQVKEWARDVATDHGRVNLIFNNAGIAYSSTVEGAEQKDFDRIMDINFWGVVYGTRQFLPFLRASGEGHVINTSSLFGLVAFPGNGTYNASKFAVRGFTEALRIELEITGAPVSATAVHPGGIKTNIARAAKMHPSMADLGITDSEKGKRDFEKMFRVTADDAAENHPPRRPEKLPPRPHRHRRKAPRPRPAPPPRLVPRPPRPSRKARHRQTAALIPIGS